MQCRIGITGNPDRRRKEWENKVRGFNNWLILDKASTIDKARRIEKDYAQRMGCNKRGGNADGGPPYYIYFFEYSREK